MVCCGFRLPFDEGGGENSVAGEHIGEYVGERAGGDECVWWWYACSAPTRFDISWDDE